MLGIDLVSLVNKKQRISYTGFLISLTLVLAACDSASSKPSASVVPTEHAKELPSMVVYKSPTCGCCQGWVDYIERAGFAVNAINHDDVDSIKVKHGLTDPSLKSCHTALIDGYVIEGHVPVSDIERLLSERPDVVGLTAPGMPMLSPGMGSEVPKDYEVLAFDKNGKSQVFSSY